MNDSALGRLAMGVAVEMFSGVMRAYEQAKVSEA